MSADLIVFPGAAPPAALPHPDTPALLPYIEPSVAPEFFTNDLVRVHVHGPFTRMVWSVPDRTADYSDIHRAEESNVVNVKLIVQTEALPAIYEALGKAIAARATVPNA